MFGVYLTVAEQMVHCDSAANDGCTSWSATLQQCLLLLIRNFVKMDWNWAKSGRAIEVQLFGQIG